jgi:hypothetical protein
MTKQFVFEKIVEQIGETARGNPIALPASLRDRGDGNTLYLEQTHNVLAGAEAIAKQEIQQLMDNGVGVRISNAKNPLGLAGPTHPKYKQFAAAVANAQEQERFNG